MKHLTYLYSRHVMSDEEDMPAQESSQCKE